MKSQGKENYCIPSMVLICPTANAIKTQNVIIPKQSLTPPKPRGKKKLKRQQKEKRRRKEEKKRAYNA